MSVLPDERRTRVVCWLVGAWVALGGAGCDGARSPVSELRPVLEALGDPAEPVAGLARELLRVLDAPSRQAVAERAAKLSAEAGVPVALERVLQPRGLSAHRRVAGVEVKDAGEDRVTLAVRLARLSLAPADGATPMGATEAIETIELTARLEDGGWRLSLADLAALIERVPVVAQGER